MNKIVSGDKLDFIVNAGLIFLLSLWLINPSNKQVVIYFIIFFFILWYKLKDWSLSALTSWIVSSVIFSGKTHIFKLLDLGKFPSLRYEYPDLGYFVTLVIKTVDIISFFMLTVIVFTVIRGIKKISLKTFDILLIIYAGSTIVANLAVSPNVFVSLYSNIEIFNAVILNFFLKLFIDKKDRVQPIYGLLSVVVIFELFVSAQQLIQSSVIGKTIEFLPSIPKFGGVADEFSAFRPVGTFNHANTLAMYAAPLFIVFFSLYIIKPSFKFMVPLISGAILTFVTLSRSAWGSLIVGFLYMLHNIEYSLKINLFKKLKMLIIISSIAIVPLLIYTFPRVVKTLYAFQPSGGGNLRLRQINESLALFARSPIFGVGNEMSVVRGIERDQSGVFTGFPAPVHNFYVLEMVEKGFVNVVIFVILIVVFLKDMYQSLKSKEKEKKIAVLGLTTAGLVLIMTAFFQPFFYLHFLVFFHHLKDYA